MKESHGPLLSLKNLLSLLAAFVCYYLAARLGLEVATLNKQASPVWPATAVAIIFVSYAGPSAALGVFLAATLSNMGTGLNLPAAIGIGLGNSLESVFAVWAFNRLMKREETYGVYSRAIFSVFILVLAAAISASVGTLILWGHGVVSSGLTSQNWITWWAGDVLGALFLIPIAFKMQQGSWGAFKIRALEWPKLIFLFILTAGLCYLIFSWSPGKPFLFLIFCSFLLAINWFQSTWLYVISLGVCIYAMTETMRGHGPFSGALINNSLIHLQLFLAGLGMTAIGLGSMKNEGVLRRPNLALAFGWLLSGMTFYFSYTTTALKDETRFYSLVEDSKEALTLRLNEYVQMLESGVSFFDASEYVSQNEWHLFAKKLLSTNRYPGIEGAGVIFSSTIQERFKSSHGSGLKEILRYQPRIPTHPVRIIEEGMATQSPEDNFVVTYVEPMAENAVALGLNISSEKNRFEAALRARDSGQPVITDKIFLVQKQSIQENRPGFLTLVPFYAASLPVTTTEERRRAFLGFVYAPVIFEKFVKSALSFYEGEVSFQFLVNGARVYSSQDWDKELERETGSEALDILGKSITLQWRRGAGFENSTSLISSGIGFFGTMVTLLLAVILSSLQNLTVRAQQIANEMTREVNERKRIWQALTEASPVGIYMTNKEGQCTYVNPTWSRMTGQSQEQATLLGWMSSIHSEDKARVQEHWARLQEGRDFACNYRYIQADKTIIHVAGQATIMKNEEHQVTGYFGTAQDITELHQNQMALLTSSRMSSLGQMASGIAHEINNPLAIIQGKALQVERMVDVQPLDLLKIKANLSGIGATVHRIAKIIKGLQAFASETSAEPFQKAFVKDSLEDTFELCRERFSHYKLHFITPQNLDSQICFWGRSEQISQVLINLLSNAFDAVMESAEDKRWVKVDVKKTEDSIQITVSDSGPGVSTAIQNKIFDPFYTTKEIGKGTGLGLSISRGIVDHHHGRLFLDITKAHTTFVMELPLYRGQSGGHQTDPAA